MVFISEGEVAFIVLNYLKDKFKNTFNAFSQEAKMLLKPFQNNV